MITLDKTTQTLQLLLDGAVTSNQVQAYVRYSADDGTGSTTGYPSKTKQTNSNSATPVTICLAPSSGGANDINHISIYQNDTAARTVTVKIVDSAGLTTTVFQATMQPGDMARYTHSGDAWSVLDKNGNVKLVTTSAAGYAGRLLNVQIIDSGTAYTPTAGTTSARVRGWGAGGGGGGVGAGGVGTGNVGGGGQAGSYVEKWYTSMTSPSLTIGAAGLAGTSGGGNGGDGGDSTFTMGGVTITAKGGKGGTGDNSPLGSAITLGGSGNVSTGGDVNGGGMPGDVGFVLVGATLGTSGMGGSCEVGAGGVSQTGEGAGNAGTGHGGGGSGALSLTAGSSHAGGVGTKGLWIIEEYS